MNEIAHMTDEQIVEAIATKVMGWTVRQSQPVLVMGRGYSATEFYAADGTRRTLAGWNPLTNPADAKAVREKLAEKWKEWELCLIPTSSRLSSERLYEFSVSNGYNHEHPAYEGYWADCDTEERAVCLCALKSVGIEP